MYEGKGCIPVGGFQNLMSTLVATKLLFTSLYHYRGGSIYINTTIPSEFISSTYIEIHVEIHISYCFSIVPGAVGARSWQCRIPIIK